MLFGSSPTCFEGVRGHGAGKSRGSAEGFLSCGWKSGTWGQQDPVLACWDGGSLGQLLGFGIYAGMLWGGVALPGSRARFQALELNLLPPKGLGMDRSCLLALLGAAVGKPRAGETALEVGAALHKPVPAQQAAPPPFFVIPDESETSPACSSFARWAVCLFFLLLTAPAVMMNHAAPRQPRRVTGVMGSCRTAGAQLGFSPSQLVPGFMLFTWPIKHGPSKQIFGNLQRREGSFSWGRKRRFLQTLAKHPCGSEASREKPGREARAGSWSERNAKQRGFARPLFAAVTHPGMHPAPSLLLLTLYDLVMQSSRFISAPLVFGCSKSSTRLITCCSSPPLK